MLQSGPERSADARRFDADSRVLLLSPWLSEGQRAFQLATQLAFLEHGPLLDELVVTAGLTSTQAEGLARIGLANYFADAVLMPYTAFHTAAEELRYDIELLQARFGVGFETVCHRLSTLQRPERRGVPFSFLRADRAGNISKRQSATDFHFSRLGGTCPLWTVYEAFSAPGRILTQVAEMPDGKKYFWIARTVTRGGFGHHAARADFAVALGCELRHAPRLVYAGGASPWTTRAPPPRSVWAAGSANVRTAPSAPGHPPAVSSPSTRTGAPWCRTRWCPSVESTCFAVRPSSSTQPPVSFSGPYGGQGLAAEDPAP